MMWMTDLSCAGEVGTLREVPISMGNRFGGSSLLGRYRDWVKPARLRGVISRVRDDLIPMNRN